MAEFALGLTKTAVEGTVSRVKLAIDEETWLKVKVQNDLMFITGEFQMMQSFLNVANKERTKNEVVRTWVRQIRDLAFDVEDCVELVVSLDIKSDWSWLWRVVPSCMAPPRPLDQAVAEIQLLKSRVEDVSQRNIRYNLITDYPGSDSSKHAPELMLPATADGRGTSSSSSSSSSFHILNEVWEAAGKKRSDMGDLRKLITSQGNDLEVISLWPSPGGGSSAADLGTRSIVRKVYNDQEIRKEFKIRAWVKLIHPFDPDQFLESLLTQFYASSNHQAANTVGLDFRKKMKAATVAMEDELIQQVKEKRYLVIVEELSTVVEWDAVRMYLPDCKNGSRIVVTTQQLGLALDCTGDPYQVSELTHFSHGRSLCAFFNKVPGRRSDTGEPIWQLRFHGVISVLNGSRDQPALVKKLYSCITHKSKEFDGAKFDRHSWIDVSSPFDMDVFARCLFLNFHSDDLRAKEITEVGMMGNKAIIQRCCRFLRDDNCLVVIDGLKSREEWDSIKATFLSEPTKSCIIVSAKDESVTKYCAEEEERQLSVKDLEADSVLCNSIKGCEYCAIGGKEASSRGRFFSNRKEEAREWTKKFDHVVPKHQVHRILKYLENPGVIFLCGIDDDEKLSVARRTYYARLLIDGQENFGFGFTSIEKKDFGFTKYSWVEVPHPFNLTDLCWRLLLDFYSDDLKAKEAAAVGLMEGQQDPVEGCLKFLRQDKCFVVIRGLRSTNDWGLIRDAVLSEPTKGCILVITNDASVEPTHEQGQVIKFQGPEADMANRTSTKNKGYLDLRSRVFSSRMVQARDWITEFELIGHDSEWSHLCMNLQQSSPLVISLWGIAGVGKSALARTIYYTNMMGFNQNLRDCTIYNVGFLNQVEKYGWVDMPHPFSLINLARRLLLDFHSDDLEAKETEAAGMMEGQDPIQRCCKLMREEKCFVVIDGLRSTDDWDLIKAAFLSDRIKGCILVITNEEAVATHCVDGGNQVTNVKGLEAEEALNLFTKITWGSEQLTSDVVSKAIMTKCGGLPKVTVAIGEYFRSLVDDKWFLKESPEKINANFISMLEADPKFHSLRGLFSWMQSYFDDCPDSLKPCIFYLSVFPLGHNIRLKRLLRRWIAEGYSRDTPGSTAEENAEKFFSQLVKLSIIQQRRPQEGAWLYMMGTQREARVCQVNGFFREYIISRPMQDNLVFALEGRCFLNSQRAGQHLTISDGWDRDKIVFEGMELSRLRSLTVFGEWSSFFISTNNANMRLLRVLDLEDTTSGVTDGVLEQIGVLLPRLKFLSLRGCKAVTRLPSSLGSLRQLQTLDMKGTSIVMLPPGIMKLEKLRYVHAGTLHCTTTSSQDHDDGMVTGGATPPPEEDGHDDGASTSQPPADGHGATSTSQPSLPAAADTRSRWPRGRLGFSLLSKLRSRHGSVVSSSSAHDDGVQFPAAAGAVIGKFTALHTLGVINVARGAGGKTFLRELNKITQLRKLRLSGINRKNWQDFCFAISGLGYLESLSVRLHEEQQHGLCCLNDISKAPETLKCLKLYGGNVHVSPLWMMQLRNLRKVHVEDLELTISTQEDIDSLVELRCHRLFRHLRVKPIRDCELHYGVDRWVWFDATKVLKIDCGSYKLKMAFGQGIPKYVEVLVVHCSCTTDQSSLELSGLENIPELKEVWLKGSYSEAVKQHLQQKLAEHPRKPVLKLEDHQHTQQSAPSLPSAC